MGEKFNWEDYAEEAERATYDPDDDKLRIYTDFVPRELYDAFRAAGFQRAPKQGCFFQVWNPTREDIALALCSEIEDEDTSLLERAQDRHYRFVTYKQNAAQRAVEASEAAHNATAGWPLGQPIIVGSKGERAQRKAIETARRKASEVVAEYDRSDYWRWRANGVIRNVNRKFSRGTTMRRIKKLEAELRKKQRELEGSDYEHALTWFISELAREHPEEFSREGVSPYRVQAIVQVAWGKKRQLQNMPKTEARLQKWQSGRERYCNRWIEHLGGQITYWKALLEENHDVDIDEQMPLKKGTWIRCSYGWAQIERVNKGAEKRITTVSVIPETATWYREGQWFYPRKVEYESIQEWKTDTDYQAMTYAEQQKHQIEKLRQQAKAAKERREAQENNPQQEAEALLEQIENTEVRVNWNPDAFFSPPYVVDRLIELASTHLRDGATMLEPSAGDGRIIKAVLERFGEPINGKGVTPFWCEINTVAAQALRDQNLGGLQLEDDFLEVPPCTIGFDVVLMNPPFGNGKWRKHIKHAYSLLKPGGRLVSVAPGNGGPYWPDGWLRDKDYHAYDLPAGTFKEAGTNIDTHIIVIDKPNGTYQQASLL